MRVRLATRRNCALTAAAVAGVILAALLAAGCTHEPTGAQRARMESCTQFGISAIKHHVTVTPLPAACSGLTKAQVSSAADDALRAILSSVHGRVRIHARAKELAPLLGRVVAAVPAQPSLPPVSAPPARAASGPPLRLVALAAWLITVGLGLVMMARWVVRGGLRRARTGSTGPSPAMNFAHLGLAVAGLVLWIVYLAAGMTGLAWIASMLLLPVAGLGMTLVSLWLPERAIAAVTVPAAQAVPVATGAAPAPLSPDPPPAGRPPALILAAHVASAVATILFTVLAAVGSG